MRNFTFYGKNVEQFTSFRDLLLYLHRQYYVAYVLIKNNDVYLADDLVGRVSTVPVDYKESHV